MTVLLIILLGIIVLCAAAGIAKGKQDAYIRNKLQKKLNEESEVEK